jgi:hypothetical protein
MLPHGDEGLVRAEVTLSVPTRNRKVSMSRQLVAAGIAVLAVFGMVRGATGKPNLVRNGSFEANYGWTVRYDGAALSSRVVGMRLPEIDGQWGLYIDDVDASPEGWLSGSILIAEGVRYMARVRRYGLQGDGINFYIKYYGADGGEVSQEHVISQKPPGEWEELSVALVAPPGAVTARVLVYSAKASIGANYCDQVEFSRADEVSYIDNSTFDIVDAVGSGVPVHWSPWGRSLDSLAVATDPDDESNKTMRIQDDSPERNAGATARFEVTPGVPYEASSRVYLENGSDPVMLFLKFYDAANNEVSSFSSWAPSETESWTSVSVSGKAPADARTGVVLAYCSRARKCAVHFDDIEAWESFAQIKHVAATARGTGDGSDPANAAAYNSSDFWASVNADLLTSPIKVVFATGSYRIRGNGDRLLLSGVGSPENALVLEAAGSYGTVFEVGDQPEGAPLIVEDSHNISVRGLRFTNASGSVGPQVTAAILVRTTAGNSSRNISIEDVKVTDMPQLVHSAVRFEGVGGKIEKPRIIRGEWIRAGVPNAYLSGNVEGLVLKDSHLETVSGEYRPIKTD